VIRSAFFAEYTVTDVVYADVLEEEFFKTGLKDVFSLRSTPGRWGPSIFSHCRILGSKLLTDTGKDDPIN
jgi:hypothetical protein